MTSLTDAMPAGMSAQAARSLAQGLGWFSIGLGLAEVLAPGKLARTLGLEGSEPIICAYGFREIASGVGILTSTDPTPWVWGRVAGDALDIASLAAGLRGDNPKKANVGLALAAVLGATALDVICAQSLGSNRRQQQLERRQQAARDYSDRSGFPSGLQAARGAASDFQAPEDFRTPEALRPWPTE